MAVAVGDALRRAGIRGVLTGGACASLYTAGAHQSVDVDIVLAGTPTVEARCGPLRRRPPYFFTTGRVSAPNASRTASAFRCGFQ